MCIRDRNMMEWRRSSLRDSAKMPLNEKRLTIKVAITMVKVSGIMVKM